MKSVARILTVFFTLSLLPTLSHAALPGFMLKRMGTMKGQVMVEGEPFGNSIVSFFLTSNGLPPVGKNMRRVPEFLARTDPEGNFSVKLAAGDYYIGMLMREDGAAPGPPREGENFFFVGDEHIEIGASPKPNIETSTNCPGL